MAAQQNGTSRTTTSIQTGNLTTTGSCNNIFVGSSGGTFTIKCDQTGMTKEQAEKQAHQLAEILNRLRQSSSSFDEMQAKLDKILADLGSLKASSEPRHLTELQRTQLHSFLFPYLGTEIDVAFENGREQSDYAKEFCSVFEQAMFTGCPGPQLPLQIQSSQMYESLSLHFPALEYANLLQRKPVRSDSPCLQLMKGLSRYVLEAKVPIYGDLEMMTTGRERRPSCLLMIGEK